MISASSIQSLFQEYFDAYSQQDAAGCASFYADDAQLFTSFGPPLIGASVIRGAHSEWFEEGEQNKTWALEYERSDANTCACLISFSSDVPTSSGGLERSTCHSLAALERDPNGQWTIQIMSMTLADAA